MSRGPGKIERAIEAAFEAEPDNAFTTEELVERLYRGVNRTEKKHRVAMLRAANTLSGREPWLAWIRSEGLGGGRVFFDRYNVISYAMARLKSASVNQYRSKDTRLLQYGTVDPNSPPGTWKVIPCAPYLAHEKSEAELWAMLKPGGKHHDAVVDGGSWWRHVRLWTAERDDETELVAKMSAENERGLAAFKAGLSRLLPS